MFFNIATAISEDFANNVSATFSTDVVYVVRMLIASICGFIIGIERGKRQKDAGIRTHLTVALGSALMMVISKYGFFDVVIFDGISLDASRIAANVITGVSFIGAGVIFVKDVSIKGLTTAAGVWATSGIGMAIGAGMYFVGIGATVMLVVCQVLLHKLLAGFESTANEFKVVLKDVPGVVEGFRKGLENNKISMSEFKMERNHEDNTVMLDVVIKKQKSMTMREVLSAASEDKNVISIDF